MTKKPFDLKGCTYGYNPVFISRLLDPYTAKVAQFLYNIGLSANMTTILTFLIGMSSIAVLFLIPGYFGLVIAAILLTIRNIGDTADGKIARGSGTMTPVGGFLDGVTDWICFHGALFIAIGYLTNNVVIGYLCMIAYLSREALRRKFEKAYGAKGETSEEAKKSKGIVSIVKLYDLSSACWIIPIFFLINKPEWVIFLTLIIEYGLLLAELMFDFYMFYKQAKEKNK